MVPKTKDELMTMLEHDRARLYELIKTGKVDYKLCTYIASNYNLYESFVATVLCHPNCDSNLFQNRFSYINVNTTNHFMVLAESYLMSRSDIILYSLSLSQSTTMDRLVEIWQTYGKKNSINIRLRSILNNPHCNTELKSKIYEATQDIEFLPKDAKDIFIF